MKKKAEYKTYLIKFNTIKDGDIIQRLENAANKNNYIRSLIFQDICGLDLKEYDKTEGK